MTHRLILQQARSQATPHGPSTHCRHRVSCSFHSPLGVLFTFPSRYWCTIGHPRVFSLARWSSLIQTGFPMLHPTRAVTSSDHSHHPRFYGRFVGRQRIVLVALVPPFRSPLLRGSLLLSVPLGTKMVQFPRFALAPSTGGS